MDAVNTTMQSCPHCKSAGPHKMKLRTKGVHYADAWCSACERHWFASKPDSDPTKYRRPSSHKDLVGKYGKGFCEMCLRDEADLPKGTTLEAQHVNEFKDGGDNTRENIWIVCTACHKLIHWVRTYHGTTIVLRNQHTDMNLAREEHDSGVRNTTIAGVENPVGRLEADGSWSWGASDQAPL